MEYFTDPLLHAPEGYYGIPTSSTDYPDLSMEIQQVVEDGSRIYVLFASSKRIIQVYDLDGQYQSTLFFYSHYDNGAFQVTTEANTLYVADECENVYVFRDGLFEQFYKEDEAVEHLIDIDFDWRYSSESYMIRNGSVWKKTPNGDVCVVERKNSPVMGMGVLLIAAFVIAVCIDFRFPNLVR